MNRRYFGQTPASDPLADMTRGRSAQAPGQVKQETGVQNAPAIVRPSSAAPWGGRIVASDIETPTSETASWQRNPLEDMMNTYKNLKVKNARLEASLMERGRSLEAQENAIANESMRMIFPAGSADLDRIIAPFFYPFLGVEVQPGRTEKVNVIISNEAPFVLMGMSRVVFRLDNGIPVAINPEERNPAIINRAAGLSFMLEDEGSTKTFMKTPIPIDLVGSPHFPFAYPVGHMFLAKSSVSATFTNEGTETFIPFLMLVGAKLYVDPRGNLGSLVSAR